MTGKTDLNPNIAQTVFCDARLPENETARLRHALRSEHGLALVLAKTGGSNLAESPSDPNLINATYSFGQPNTNDLLASTSLKFVQLTSAGYARYDTPELRAHLGKINAPLANASGVYDEPCAQHALSFVLAAARQLPAAFDNQRASQGWPYVALRQHSRLLRDQEVLIVGYGAIARRLIELLAPFKLRIRALRRNVRGDEAVKTYPITAIDELLPSADHVVNILPGTSSTANFFDAWKFRLTRPTATYYNIGRGTTTNQDALEYALRNGQLAAAYLDVTDPEPLPPVHPLWKTPNCHITPHTAGGFDGEAAALVDHFLANLRRFRKDEPLANRIY